MAGSAIEHSDGGKAATPQGGLRPAVLLSWLALAIAVGFFGYFLLRAGALDSISQSPQAAPPADVTEEKVTVSTSSISGFDREQQPYTVNAQSAVQDPDEPNIIHLKTVTGKLSRASGQRFTIDAQRGVYDSDGKTLDLAGDVHIISLDRFVAAMPAARVMLEDKQLVTNERVLVTFDGGDIAANGMRISDQGKNIEFLNRVKVRLRSAADKEDKDGND